MEIMEALFIVHILLQICGLSQWQLDHTTWSIRKSRLLEAYTIIVIVCSIFFLCYGLFSDNYLNPTTTSDIGETVDFIQMVGIRLSHAVCLTESLLRKKDQLAFNQQVREIDRIFERALNVSLDNGKFRQQTLQRAIIMYTIYLASELFILAIKLVSSENHFILSWFCYLVPLLICGLRYFQINTTILIIKCRFDKLIQIMSDINLLQNDVFFDGNIKVISHNFPLHKRRYEEKHHQLKRLLIIRDIYNRLWELSVVVNRCFGVSMLINVGNDFISITSNCYWIFLNFKAYTSTAMDFLQIAGSAAWSIPHLFNVLVLAITCERALQSTTGIALGLHRIEIDVLNDNHNTVIEQFSLQLLHQKMAFTAAGFFKIDCTLLYTIVGATTTYLIILIQFHLNEIAPDGEQSGAANFTIPEPELI